MKTKLLFLSLLLIIPTLAFAQKEKIDRNKRSMKSKSALSQTIQTFTINGVSFEMVYIPKGSFTMGCTSEQVGDCKSDEKPNHLVSLDAYYIGKFEVTQELWGAVMGNNPSQ